MKLSSKSKILLSTLVSLLLGGALITSFTLAWLSLNVKVDSINLIAGVAEARVDGYMFKRNYTVDTAKQIDPAVNETPNISATPISTSQSELVFTFIDATGEMYPQWDLMNLPFDEVSMNALEISAFFLELQVFTTVQESYMRISLWLESFEDGAPDYTNFSYRYQAANNNLSDPLDYATPSNVDVLANKPYVSLYNGYNPATGIILNENTNPYFELSVAPQNAAFYEQNFYKSIIIEVGIEPLTFYNYLRETANIVNTQKTFGLRLVTLFEYSIEPFGS